MKTAPRPIASTLALAGILVFALVTGACSEQESPLIAGDRATPTSTPTVDELVQAAVGSYGHSDTCHTANLGTRCASYRNPSTNCRSYAAAHLHSGTNRHYRSYAVAYFHSGNQRPPPFRRDKP